MNETELILLHFLSAWDYKDKVTLLDNTKKGIIISKKQSYINDSYRFNVLWEDDVKEWVSIYNLCNLTRVKQLEEFDFSQIKDLKVGDIVKGHYASNMPFQGKVVDAYCHNIDQYGRLEEYSNTVGFKYQIIEYLIDDSTDSGRWVFSCEVELVVNEYDYNHTKNKIPDLPFKA